MIAKGTIGNNPCEISLNEILMEKNDDKLVHKVCARIHKFRKDLKSFMEISDSSFREQMFQLYLKDVKRTIERYNIPEEVHSHLRCCLHAYVSEYRDKQNKRL
jgi:hypothetical protein